MGTNPVRAVPSGSRNRAAMLTRGLPVLLLLSSVAAAAASWPFVTGTTSREAVRGVATDSSGNVIMVGYTYGAYSGAGCTCDTSTIYYHSWSSCRNTTDTLIVKVNSDSDVLWSRQECSAATDDWAEVVATDGSDNVYVAGVTYTAITGAIKAHGGQADMYIFKYDSSGTTGTRLVTHYGGMNADEPRGIAVDPTSSFVYVTGYVYGGPEGDAQWTDMILLKYNTALVLQWAQQDGTSGNDRGHGVAVEDDGNVFVAGVTDGACAVWRYSAAGVQAWRATLPIYLDPEELHYEWSVCRGAATDGTHVYTTGITGGSVDPDNLNEGWTDSFAAKFNGASGALVWANRISSVVNDYGRAVAVDTSNDVYVVGYTEGTIGAKNSGSWDAWMMKFTSSGSRLHTEQLGSGKDDMAFSVATHGGSTAYIAGFMQDSSTSTALGEFDFVVWKHSDAFDYTSIIITVVVLLCCCCVKPCYTWAVAAVLLTCCGGCGGVTGRIAWKLRQRRRAKHFKPVAMGDSD